MDHHNSANRPHGGATDPLNGNESFRSGEDFYRTMFNSIDAGFCVIEVLFDAAGEPVDLRFLEVNAAFERQTGLVNAVGKTMRSLSPTIEDHWFRVYGKVALTGEPVRFENRAEALGRWFELYAFRVGQPGGRQVAVLFKDITDRKLAERALRDSEQRLRLMVGQMPAMLWTTDADLRMTSGTGAALAKLNVAPNECIGRRLIDYFGAPEADCPSIIAHRRALNGESVGYEIEWGGRNYEAHVEPLCDDLGRIVGTIGVAIDITERCQAEAALRESEGRLRLFIEHAPAALAMFDADMRYLALSRRWLTDYGLEPAAVLGRSHYEVFPEMPEEWKAAHRRGLAGEVLRSDNDRFVRADGSVHWSRWEIRPWNRDDGTIGGIVIFSEDITARRRAEMQRDELLAREQTARREAESANRNKDEFLTMLSHELRTPLTSMLGWIQMLRKGVIPGEQLKAALESIEGSTKAQIQMVGDILDVSRVITGKMVLALRPTDLCAVIREAVSVVTPAAVAKGIRMTASLPESGPAIIGDLDRLRQIVWNLLQNAVKFTPTGGSVDVGVLVEGGDVVISVRDTGEGIGPEFLPFVFERFRQADRDKSREHGGLGLGLSLVRHLVELHGGRVAAESDGPGRGATFTVRLPLQRE